MKPTAGQVGAIQCSTECANRVPAPIADAHLTKEGAASDPSLSKQGGTVGTGNPILRQQFRKVNLSRAQRDRSF